MKTVILAAVAAFALTACGGAGGKSALVASCKKDGNDDKTCNCMADEMEKGLDKKTFAAIVKAASGKEEDAQKAMQELPAEEAMKAMPVMMGVAVKCGAMK